MTTDFSTVKVGDRVRLTGNDEVHEFVVDRVRSNASGLYLLDARLQAFASDEGWTLEILERAKPVLPTEPGYYSAHDKLANSDFVVRITEGGEIQFQQGSKWDKLGDPERFAPFTRLTPAESND